jgi:hypothetical protein
MEDLQLEEEVHFLKHINGYPPFDDFKSITDKWPYASAAMDNVKWVYKNLGCLNFGRLVHDGLVKISRDKDGHVIPFKFMTIENDEKLKQIKYG